tara:strand:- start:282 stop:458 length:177 start_codon:yes stop_codon:yes gene_type:complete
VQPEVLLRLHPLIFLNTMTASSALQLQAFRIEHWAVAYRAAAAALVMFAVAVEHFVDR